MDADTAVAMPLETRPHDCFDWLTPERVSALAAWAFACARSSTFPEPGGSFFDLECGNQWSSRADFAEMLGFLFGLAVKRVGGDSCKKPQKQA